MESSAFYDTKKIPVPERESFNNTILLLTLIKSQYYYIIGFSRPEHIIKIGFDYESEAYGTLSETLEIDFCNSSEYVTMRAVLNNVNAERWQVLKDFFVGKGRVCKTEDKIIYEYNLSKDKVLPIGINDMNTYIMEAKKDIGVFLEMYYLQYIRP